MNIYNKCYIFQTRVDNFSKNDILKKIASFLAGESFKQINTLNPEILLLARKSKHFRAILNNSELNIVDGVGVNIAFWKKRQKLQCRYTGADLIWDIFDMANERDYGVFLLANKDGFSSWQETRDAIKKVYPHLRIGGKNISITPSSQIWEETPNTMDKLRFTDYELLITNLGAPHQETFLSKFKNTKTSLKVGIGVGGAFDYTTGKIKRAPKCMRKFGFEWLYRLVKQPKRFKRIWNAVFVFPIKVLFCNNE